MNKVKLFISDIDGTLTDSTVYYSSRGEELKQFSHRDGMGFYLLHTNSKIKVFLFTSEYGGINQARGDKLLKLCTIERYIDGNYKADKLTILKELCIEFNCDLSEIAYIGDDVNDLECLKVAGFPACPWDAHQAILDIPNIYVTENNGGEGSVRNFIDYLLENDMVYRGLNDN